jgi:hypothetical protein
VGDPAFSTRPDAASGGFGDVHPASSSMMSCVMSSAPLHDALFPGRPMFSGWDRNCKSLTAHGYFIETISSQYAMSDTH